VLRSLRFPPRQGGCAPGAGGWGRLLLWVATALLMALHAPLRAEPIELESFELVRNEDGLLLGFSAQFELPHSVEDALLKGVPVYFVAEAEVYRDRWYWRDKLITASTRTWRLAYQPLTFSYRVNFGGLGQTYPTLAEALRTVQRSTSWRVADPIAPPDGGQYHVEFSYRLDRDQLPRPLQIGLGNSPEWNLQVERIVPVRLR
jgi:hypothetical protein